MTYELAVFDSVVPVDVLTTIAKIYIECFTGPPRFENWEMETVLAELSRFAAGGADFIVARDEAGDIHAFAIGIAMKSYYKREEFIALGAEPNSYVNAAMGTLPQYRNRGLGLSLHKMREELALKRGFDTIVGRVRDDNESQLSLLNKLGYVETSRYTSTFGGSTAERVIVTKSGLKRSSSAAVENSKSITLPA